MTRRIARAVIGAGYGDEGKGLITDALAAAGPQQPVVVRFNGGAQAGHTVTLEDGRRHVFHHWGAGALAGAATHLSRFFVHHPMLLEAERDALERFGGCLEASADPRGLVTTPWDMLVNQAVERSRGADRHGSCGLGFGETVERSLDPAFRLTAADFGRPDLRQRLERIRREWIPARIARLGAGPLTEGEARVLDDDGVLEVFMEDCGRFSDMIALRADATLGGERPVIFEGAQGLMLDQAIGSFPHVTRSHTGLVNVAAVAREAGLDEVDAIYVTRAYATRHGAGPLPGGSETLEGFVVQDPTNAPNVWQGRMRYALLDLDRLRAAMAADGKLADAGPLTLRTSLAVTCLDQAVGPVRCRNLGESRRMTADTFADEAAARLGMPLRAQSWGPARSGVRFNAPAAVAA